MWKFIDNASFTDVIITLLKLVCIIICIIGGIQLIMIMIEIPMLALILGIIVMMTAGIVRDGK